MTGTNDISALSSILSAIDLGPTDSIQFSFAKLQMAQAQICKSKANDYMKQIENVQAEQKKVAELISLARDLQKKGEAGQGVGIKSIDGVTTAGADCYPMPQELVDFMDLHELAYQNADNDHILGKEEWTFAIQSLTNYQESISNQTQTMMVYLQDFISQYNSYTQGATSMIDKGAQVLTSVATGR